MSQGRALETAQPNLWHGSRWIVVLGGRLVVARPQVIPNVWHRRVMEWTWYCYSLSAFDCCSQELCRLSIIPAVSIVSTAFGVVVVVRTSVASSPSVGFNVSSVSGLALYIGGPRRRAVLGDVSSRTPASSSWQTMRSGPSGALDPDAVSAPLSVSSVEAGSRELPGAAGLFPCLSGRR